MFAETANVGVVGATGVVGSLIREILVERNFPVADVRLFASEKSAGKQLSFGNSEISVEDAGAASFSGVDIVLMSAGGSTSRELAPKIAADGAYVIDNSSAWRMDDDVPLVVSEVNPQALSSIPKKIIANPNCTTMVAMPVLKPLHEKFGLQKIIASTYQSVSGSGGRGVRELEEQAGKVANDLDPLLRSGEGVPNGSVYAKPIAFNVLPLAGMLVDDETDEEHKFRNESRKILGIPELSVQTTCVRVPVVTGHSISIAATFEQPIAIESAKKLLNEAPGVQLADIPNPLEATGGDHTLVGRFRVDADDSKTLHLFLSGDNLRKGAALNAVQIAELLMSL
jgi:aspartate-semialdehyde dehydrogenase